MSDNATNAANVAAKAKAREERLAASLRANLRKRKVQKKARAGEEDTSEAPAEDASVKNDGQNEGA